MSKTIELRSAGAEVLNVNWADRLITVIAVPYEQPALVEYGGEVWEEVFAPGAFAGLDGTDPERIRVNREHSRADAIGKAVRFDTRDPRRSGSRHQDCQHCTRRGHPRTGGRKYALASVGFGVTRRGQVLDRARRTRRVTSATLDHIALVQAPAYDGAQVLAVRSTTPHLDAFVNDPIVVWASWYNHPVTQWARRRLAR